MRGERGVHVVVLAGEAAERHGTESTSWRCVEELSFKVKQIMCVRVL